MSLFARTCVTFHTFEDLGDCTLQLEHRWHRSGIQICSDLSHLPFTKRHGDDGSKNPGVEAEILTSGWRSGSTRPMPQASELVPWFVRGKRSRVKPPGWRALDMGALISIQKDSRAICILEAAPSTGKEGSTKLASKGTLR
jgi:hypothetical protein